MSRESWCQPGRRPTWGAVFVPAPWWVPAVGVLSGLQVAPGGTLLLGSVLAFCRPREGDQLTHQTSQRKSPARACAIPELLVTEMAVVWHLGEPVGAESVSDVTRAQGRVAGVVGSSLLSLPRGLPSLANVDREGRACNWGWETLPRDLAGWGRGHFRREELVCPLYSGDREQTQCAVLGKTRKSQSSPAGGWEGPALESGQTPAWPCTCVGDQAAVPAVPAVQPAW